MQLASFVSYAARDMIRQHKGNKEILLKDEIVFGIIPMALLQMDKVNSKIELPPQEYVIKSFSIPNSSEMLQVIKDVYDNFDNKNWDTSLEPNERKKILINSINIIKPFVNDLEKNYNYAKFQKDNSNNERNKLKIAYTIIENLELKLKDEKEVKRLLDSLSSIKMNFWMNSPCGKIYPFISDLLEDTIALEFSFYTDKTLIKSIITVWKEAIEAQNERNFFNYTAFTKMEFIEVMTYNKMRGFLLAEYRRVLNVDEKKLRTCMRHILYYDISKHKQSVPLGFDKIDKIPPRPFLLERTKTILGEVDPEIHLSSH